MTRSTFEKLTKGFLRTPKIPSSVPGTYHPRKPLSLYRYNIYTVIKWLGYRYDL